MLEIDIEDIYKPGTVLDMPKRPSWDYQMSAEKVLAREEKYFRVRTLENSQQYGMISKYNLFETISQNLKQ